MAALDFPLSPTTESEVTTGDITWKWNGYAWYATSQAGDVYLSKVTDDTAAGEITFEKLTTHEAGVSVTGGSAASVVTGICINGDRLAAAKDGEVAAIFNPQGNSQFTVGSSDRNKALTGLQGISSMWSSANHGNQAIDLFYAPITEDTNTSGTVNGVRVVTGETQTGTGQFVGYRSVINTSDVPNGEPYNFYAGGDAPNYFNGAVKIGNANIATEPQERLAINYVIKQIRGSAGPTTRFYIGPVADSGLGNSVSTIEVTAAGASFNDTSDYRLKTNITPLPSAVDAIKALKPCSFSMRGTDGIKGFVAHELQEVLPEAVKGTKDETEAIGTLADYDGTVLETEITEPEELEYTEEVETDGVATMVTRTRTWTATGTRPVYQSVAQTKLIPLLTKALQEALDRIEQLESNTLQPLYASLADLPSATDHHGKVAHVHSEGALYFAHAGNWVKLQNA